MKTISHTLFDNTFAKQLLIGLGKVSVLNSQKAANETGHPTTSKRSFDKAEAALQRLSDAELQDLGITRGEIAYVVRHGRPGIDPDTDPASQCAA